MEALVLVDIQNDFLPGGALPAQNGDAVIPVVNALHDRFDRVVATKDWHPKNHGSFASAHNKPVGEVIDLEGVEQILWPDHCVQGTRGAEFPSDLHLSKLEMIFQKGVDPNIDSYGSFYDNDWRRNTGLQTYLNWHKVRNIIVVGLTTDYCVKHTVLDGLKLGFKVTVVKDACRPVNLQPGDEEKALAEMEAAGARVVESSDLL